MDSFIFDSNTPVCLPIQADAALIRSLLTGYAGKNTGKIRLSESRENCITVGEGEPLALDGSSYAFRVTANGATVVGADYPSLMNGFAAFLERIGFDRSPREPGTKPARAVPCGEERGKPALAVRMVHLCVFPDDNLSFLRKCVRACGMAKYTHIVLEFWGMLQYDCMKELSWEFAYTKEQLRPIIREANAMGMEVIPMFNHYGHASACREINGKHVVLDQNPEYGYLFDSYGWIWNLHEAEVHALHRAIRSELIELCGAGSYFHIGCDEAYRMGSDGAMAAEFCAYVNAIQKEMSAVGRRCILWGDMLLDKQRFRGEKQYYSANSTAAVAEKLLCDLDKNVILADWQYDVTGEAWKSAKLLKDAGFDVLCCSWYGNGNIHSAVQTAAEHEMYGYMHTTWHQLFEHFPDMLYAGKAAYLGKPDAEAAALSRFYAAATARAVAPSEGVYENAGWSGKMTGPGL